MAGVISGSDPFSYLHRTGIMSSGIPKGADRVPKVKAVAVSVKRPPEFPSRTPNGPREGHPVGRVKSTAKEGSSFVNEANVKGRNGDGWKPGDNAPARSGSETGASQGFESPGDKRARAAGKRGVETKSAKSDVGAGAAKRVGAKRANIEGNESAKYEKLEKRSLRSLKGGGTDKELRAGHNERAKKSMKPSGGKVAATMQEFKAGKLHSGSKQGPKVTNRRQAVAIGLNQARRAGEKVAAKA